MRRRLLVKVMIFSDIASFLNSGRTVKRAVASVVSRAGLIMPLALLLIAVAACGDDDGSGQETGSPTPSSQITVGPSPTDNGGSGQASPTATSSAGDQTTPPAGLNSGTAIIGDIQYDFTTASCAITPDSVVVLGTGQASDGRPFIVTASWYRVDVLGNEDAFDVGIHTNIAGLLDPADQSFRMGNAVANSTVESIDIDVTGFDISATGTFVDQKALEALPVEGSFTLSCS